MHSTLTGNLTRTGLLLPKITPVPPCLTASLTEVSFPHSTQHDREWQGEPGYFFGTGTRQRVAERASVRCWGLTVVKTEIWGERAQFRRFLAGVMKVGAAALAGGIFGAVGTLCFFLAFGTDYWLVASDNCGPYTWPKDANGTEVGQTCAYNCA